MGRMFKTLLSFILIILIFLSSFGVTVYRLKDPEFLNEQVSKANLYGRLSSRLPQLLPDDFAKGIGLGKEDLADVITAAVDSQTFYSFTSALTREYLLWLTGEKADLQFNYDLTATKVASRERAVDRLLVKYENLPLCDAKQVKTWSTENGLPTCKLPTNNVQSNDIGRLLGQPVDRLLDQLPNEISTTSPTPTLLQWRANVLTGLQFIRTTWLTTFVFLLLFLLIYRRKGFLSLAFIFLVAGLLEAAFSLIAWDWVGRVITDLLPAKWGDTLPLTIDLITTVLDVLKKSLSRLSIGLLCIGGLFLVLWVFLRPKQSKMVIPPTGR